MVEENDGGCLFAHKVIIACTWGNNWRWPNVSLCTSLFLWSARWVDLEWWIILQPLRTTELSIQFLLFTLWCIIVLTKLWCWICRSSIEAFASAVAPLAESLLQILAQKLNMKFSYFQENCSANTCFLRLNRYPPCPLHSRVFGLLPHTDSSFLTILNQDQIGGLQLMKDGKWISVKPNPQALVVNIGDLFQVMLSPFLLHSYEFILSVLI